MTRPFKLPLNCRGDLDTAMPVSDRAPGTLVSAVDTHYRYWGPKRGSGAFTQAQEGPGTAALYDQIVTTGVYGGTHGGDWAQSGNSDDQFRDLGTQFTLDIWFRLEDAAFSAVGVDGIGLYSFTNGGGGIALWVYGSTDPNHERIHFSGAVSVSRGSSDVGVDYISTARVSIGTGQTNKQHVRVVRDGISFYLYINGVLDGSTVVSNTSGSIQKRLVIGSYGSSATVQIGAAQQITAFPSFPATFAVGTIYGAVLRDGAFRTLPIEARMPSGPWSRGVHHYYLGHNYALGGNDHYFDAGRFGVHARIPGTKHTVTSSNDNAAPAPCSVQGMRTWTSRTNRTATSVMTGGVLATSIVS